MTLRFRSASAAAAALVLGTSLVVAGCGKYSMATLKAQKAYKQAVEFYKAQDWKQAAANYEYTIQQNPDKVEAYFYLGNSYDNLYKPSRQGEPENDAYMQKAIENYQKAAQRDPNPQMKKLALEYLVSAYGPEKLNAPDKAEPIVQQMIQMEPNEPANYFALSKIYEDAGKYEEAEATLLKAREARPDDPTVYMQLAGYYNRLGEFDKTIDALQQRASKEPNNPEVYYTIASYYWDKAFRDFRLSDVQKRDYITKGLEADEQALKIKGDYIEAIVYKGLLLRLQANVEKDAAKQQALLKEAEALQEKAQELQKKSATGD